MSGYINNIEKETLENKNFRKVLFTATNSQLVVMSLLPGEEIGMEVHEDHDQFIRIEQGEGLVSLDGQETKVKDDWAIVVPAGTQHNVVNTSSDKEMKLYTIYSPPEHPADTVHATKAEADAYEAEKHKH